MNAEWYLKVADKEIGPLTAQQLRTMAANGQLSPEDPVRRGATGNWVGANRVKGLFPAAEPAKAESADTQAAAAEPEQEKAPAQPAKAVPVAVVPVAAAPVQVAAASAPATPQPIAWSPTTGGGSGGSTGQGSSDRANRLQSRRKSQHQTAIVLLVVLVPTIIIGVALLMSRGGGGGGERPGPRSKASTAVAKPPPEVAEGQTSAEDAVAELTEAAKTAKPVAASSAPAAEAPDAAAPAPADAEPWVNAATSPVIMGDLVLKVASAEIGLPIGKVANRELFMVSLEIENRSQERKFDFRWGARGPRSKLTDDLPQPNSYQPLVNSSLPESVYPGSSETATLYFQKPIETAKNLYLVVPGSCFNYAKDVRLEISMTMVTHRAPEPKPAPAKRRTAAAEVDDEPAAEQPEEPAPDEPSSDDPVMPATMRNKDFEGDSPSAEDEEEATEEKPAAKGRSKRSPAGRKEPKITDF